MIPNQSSHINGKSESPPPRFDRGQWVWHQHYRRCWVIVHLTAGNSWQYKVRTESGVEVEVPQSELRELTPDQWDDKEEADACGWLRGTHWKRDYDDLHTLLDANEAKMMNFLLQWQRTHDERQEFYCTTGTLIRHGRFRESTADFLLKKLAKKGYIGISRKRQCGVVKRHVTIHYAKLKADLEAATLEWQQYVRKWMADRNEDVSDDDDTLPIADDLPVMDDAPIIDEDEVDGEVDEVEKVFKIWGNRTNP